MKRGAFGARLREQIQSFRSTGWRSSGSHRQNDVRPRLTHMLMRSVLTLLASLSLARAGELHEAALACKVDRMRQILQQRPSLNEADADGLTPLHIATDFRHVLCVG